MNDYLFELAKKLNANPEYRKKILECKNKEEIFNYCNSICGGYTREELEKFILGIISVENLNKVPIYDGELKNISGGMEKGTVEQISDKIDAISGAQGILLNLSKVFNKVYFMDDMDNLSPREIMQLTMDLASSLGMN